MPDSNGPALGSETAAATGTVGGTVVVAGSRRSVLNLIDAYAWFVSVGSGLILWELVGRFGPFAFFPPLSDAVGSLIDQASRGVFWSDAAQTFRTMLIGFVLAWVMGMVVGILIGRFAAADAVLGMYVDLFQSAPASALVPALVLIFGLGSESIVAIVFFFSFFIIVVNVSTGIKETSPALLEMGRSVGAGELTMLRRVILPSAMPFILAGTRLGVGRAFSGVILGEMIIALRGLGGRLMTLGGSFNMPALFGILLGIVIIALTVMGLLRVLERRVLRWMHQ